MPVERTVYVLDDDEAVCRSLERLLDSANFVPITFERPDMFLSAARTFKTGCVLLDVRLPGMSGLEVQEQLHKIRNDLPIIVLTAQGDVQTAVRAMKAGAVDFIEKPFASEAILDSLDMALARLAAPNEQDPVVVAAATKLALLSPREREVLEGLLAGLPNKTIAYDLAISPRTVEIHRARVMDKMGARSLSELIRLALAAGVRPSSQ